MSVVNIEAKPMQVSIGKDTAQIQTIKCVADVSSSLNNKYFLFHDSSGVKRYAWYSTGAGIDPAPAGGWTGSAIVIAANDSATAVATATAAILTAVSGFDATSSGAVVTLVATAIGYAQPAIDSVAAPTTFAFKVTTLGQTKLSAGCLSGPIELSGFSQDKLEIKCHHTGSTIVDERITGYQKPVLSMILQETDKATLQRILVYYGMPVFTPVGADKEAVFGYGPQNVGGSNPRVLITMHEVGDDASDKQNDWNFWTCELALDTFNFDGEAVSQFPATFNIYPDETKPKGIQFFMVGDAAKAGY